jgi:hypothetical protein
MESILKLQKHLGISALEMLSHHFDSFIALFLVIESTRSQS